MDLSIRTGTAAVAALALSLVLSVPAGAQNPPSAGGAIDGSNPQVILDIASSFGTANIETDDLGDPMIRGRIDGIIYAVFFYGCTNHVACNQIQFYASWSDVTITTDALNSWNRDTRYGKAFLDNERLPVLNMDVNLTAGVTEANMRDTFEWWKVVLADFSDELARK
jgi:hypothetical protein